MSTQSSPLHTALPLAPVLAVLAALTAACGGGGGGGSSGSAGNLFAIVNCSLGCSSGVGGSQVSCGTNSIFVNQELAVEFTQSVDFSTVNKNTFQVTNLATGATPTGTFLLDPTNDKRLIFRPQLTFDSGGNPVFGLDPSASYSLRIPGEASGDPAPYIASTAGLNNAVRLLCTVIADQGVNDPVSGAPSVLATVDVVTSYDPLTGEPATIATDVPADGATNVYRDTLITLTFNDVMNPATLVNPVTGLSANIQVSVDPDGNVFGTGDQVELFGVFTLDVDEDALVTTVVFQPSLGLPSAGAGATKRKIVVELPAAIQDLGGNALSNAGKVVFEPEVLIFAETLLPDGTGETFADTDNMDAKRTGAAWGEGTLLPGAGGGSGKLGDLIVRTGEVLELSTDGATFAGRGLIGEGGDPVDPDLGPSIEVTDGIFEFDHVLVESGGVLRVTGTNPARLYGRGEISIDGLLDLSGSAAPDNALGGHQGWEDPVKPAFESTLEGGLGGAGGPAAGNGGDGADRPDNTGSDLTTIVSFAKYGISNPGFDSIDGLAGEGVGGTPAASGLANGKGGTHHPLNLPTSKTDKGGLLFDLVCVTDMIASPGGGGGYATAGKPAAPVAPNALLNSILIIPLLIPNPAAQGGDPATLDLASYKTLDPDGGYLAGGSGGGGGGAHVSQSRAGFFGFCDLSPLTEYVSHSGAGGGGGGGAIQIQAGRRLRVDGIVDASGGGGGSSFSSGGLDISPLLCQPGGAGSGGGVLLQSVEIQVSDIPGRIDVNGGTGGIGHANTKGGEGGAGLVRLEGAVALDVLGEAPKISPFDPATETYGGPDSDKLLSVDLWNITSQGPGGFSGAQSCWVTAPGNVFTLDFAEDEIVGGELQLGWDVALILNVPGFEHTSWRSPLPEIGGVSLEQLLGSDLNGVTPSPFIVRFQGARAVKTLSDPCGVDPTDATGPILPESVTGWVRHPEELDTYFDFLGPQEAAKLRPNLFRFVVLFDKNQGFSPGLIAGATDLQVRATPD